MYVVLQVFACLMDKTYGAMGPNMTNLGFIVGPIEEAVTNLALTLLV